MATALAVLSVAVAAQSVVRYTAVPNWLVLPEGRTAIGSMHGDVAVSRADEVYVSVEGSVTQRFAVLGPNAGLQVYSSAGRFLRNVERAPSDLHGFVIHRDDDGAEGNIGDKLPIHDVYVDPIRATGFALRDLVAQPGEVGRQYGYGDFHGGVMIHDGIGKIKAFQYQWRINGGKWR